jgi:hypothetical protein
VRVFGKFRSAAAVGQPAKAPHYVDFITQVSVDNRRQLGNSAIPLLRGVPNKSHLRRQGGRNTARNNASMPHAMALIKNYVTPDLLPVGSSKDGIFGRKKGATGIWHFGRPCSG